MMPLFKFWQKINILVAILDFIRIRKTLCIFNHFEKYLIICIVLNNSYLDTNIITKWGLYYAFNFILTENQYFGGHFGFY